MNSLTSTSPWILIPLLHKEIANMLSTVHVVITFTKTQAGWSWGCSQELVVVDGARHPLPPRALRVLCSVRDLCRHAVGTHHRPRNSTHRKVQVSPLPHRHCRRWFGDQVCSWNHSGSRKEVRKKKSIVTTSMAFERQDQLPILQSLMKLWKHEAPCENIIINFKMITTEHEIEPGALLIMSRLAVQVAHPQTQPCLEVI